MVDSSHKFERFKHFQYAHIKFNGILDVDGARQVADQIASLVPTDYEGYLVVDVSNMDYRLTNDDIDRIVELFNAKRYFFKRPTAFIHPEGEVGISVGFYKSAIDREGILVNDFQNLEDALNWLSNPEK